MAAVVPVAMAAVDLIVALSYRFDVPMPRAEIDSLLRKYPRISDQVDERELGIILSELSRQLDQGKGGESVVELGCYIGTTSLFIRRILDQYKADMRFHVYDSFVGLPPKAAQDSSPAGEQFKTGELAVSRKVFELQFKKAGLRLPVIHKAWFNDLSGEDLPDDITFAYLDGDYYESIRDSLRLVWPKLVTGACVVVDDYANEALPGAARAVDEWLRDHPATLRVESSLIRP
jgi:O-methyltransferase